MTAQRVPADAPDRKAVLFCPRCAHESPLSGDWVLEGSEGDVTYVCPECEEVVVSQSRPLVHC